MARNGPSASAKGKAKAYGPPTRASPRLAALRSQAAINSQPEAPVTPAVLALAIAKWTARMSPPKKRPIQNAAGEGTSKATAQSFHRRSHRIAAIGRSFTQAPKEQEVIAISNDSEKEPAISSDSSKPLGT
ncbi:hypothetical protein PIB30_093654 [Stylosanthes scabra]|uniref:Uncharacterized protein n=1 Tax=Stylosanthes scabra TaxID=79078 RepID=A0ABU6TUW5_9FABA|nr:hypothetical protein [Stylosanthes scabra]